MYSLQDSNFRELISSHACFSFPSFQAFCVSFMLIFKENFCGFSERSFKVIIYGKLLRFNDSCGVSCLTAATNQTVKI